MKNKQVSELKANAYIRLDYFTISKKKPVQGRLDWLRRWFLVLLCKSFSFLVLSSLMLTKLRSN